MTFKDDSENDKAFYTPKCMNVALNTPNVGNATPNAWKLSMKRPRKRRNIDKCIMRWRGLNRR